MKKILLVMLVSSSFFLAACGNEIGIDQTEEIVSQPKREYTEENDNEDKDDKVREKNDKNTSNPKNTKNPKPNEKPKDDTESEPAEITEIMVEKPLVIKDNTESKDEPFSGPKFEIEDKYLEDQNLSEDELVDVYYYGQEDYKNRLPEYEIESFSIDDTGEAMVFAPKISGGKLKVERISYDSEAGTFIKVETLKELVIKDKQALLLKMYLPETIPSVMITYEKEGDYIIQTIPSYKGTSGKIKLDKGFKIMEPEN